MGAWCLKILLLGKNSFSVVIAGVWEGGVFVFLCLRVFEKRILANPLHCTKTHKHQNTQTRTFIALNVVGRLQRGKGENFFCFAPKSLKINSQYTKFL